MQAETIDRRTFLKLGYYSVMLSWLPVHMYARSSAITAAVSPNIDTMHQWSDQSGKARYRIDGWAKVTGQKVFGKDFRASDFEGWPSNERIAILLRATTVSKRFVGIQFNMLPPEIRPIEAIIGGRFRHENDTIFQTLYTSKGNQSFEVNLFGLENGLFVPKDSPPAFYGQPVAMLIFSDAATARKAKAALKKQPIIQYIHDVEEQEANSEGDRSYYDNKALVRVVSKGKERFSLVSDYHYGLQYKAEAFLWEHYLHYKVESQLESGDWIALEHQFSTQAMDPMFMETESGLAWYSVETSTLNLIVGTQSPAADIRHCAKMFDAPGTPLRPGEIALYSCYPGGSFGGKSGSTFSCFLSIAAAFSNGQPVRLAYDRSDQFLAGLKRHASTMHHRLIADKHGKIQAVISSLSFDGGGRKNHSPAVANVAALCAGGAYRIPLASVQSRSYHSQSISGGSQRGFGGPQAFLAMETSMDELAEKLGLDPIELRRKNILGWKEKIVTGGEVANDPRLEEILNIASNHPLWKDRNLKQHDKGPWAHGVGFALSMQPFGANIDGMLGYVGIDASGKINVVTDTVDMGTGSATTLSVIPARWLGSNAFDIRMGQPGFFQALQLTSSKDSGWENPRWVPKISGSSGASTVAFQQVHAIEKASEVLFKVSLTPAAVMLWEQQGKQVKASQVTIDTNGLHAPNCAHLSLNDIAKTLQQCGLPMGAMVHASFSGSWAEADYTVNGKTHRWPIDALSLKMPNGDFMAIERKNLLPFSKKSVLSRRTMFTPCGNLVKVMVHKENGEVKVTDAVTILNAGPLIIPAFVEGQHEGGLAMAIGYALKEKIPLDANGPANGTWNLDQYHVPLAEDTPHDRQQLICLPPKKGEHASRGIAEAVMSAVAPAILNAIHNAIGRRFTELPVTADKIMEALQKA